MASKRGALWTETTGSTTCIRRGVDEAFRLHLAAERGIGKVGAIGVKAGVELGHGAVY